MSLEQQATAELIEVARDLTRSLSEDQRYLRLVEATRRVVESDAAALFRRSEDGSLRPLAVRGLSAETLGRRFHPEDHPRLKAILRSSEPVVFATDDPRPDPFDGLVQGREGAGFDVHSCMGCALRDAGEAIGVLTLDALEPGRFDEVDLAAVAAFASLAASAVRTAELIETLQRLAEARGQAAQVMVRDELLKHGGRMIGQSRVMRTVHREVEMVAQTDLPVLVTGQTGTGKELVARSIHDRSARREQLLVHVNCAALPESVVESELFGHQRGAFTGAHRTRPGKFQMADGATLFLDEVGELPLGVQTKLLRALQFGEVQPVGADIVRHVDVRVIAATNRDLRQEVARGTFRADLYHRLDVLQIHVPPLVERAEDIALLAGHFLDGMRSRFGVAQVRLSASALARLEAYDWPGNVRELEHTLMRAVLRAKSSARKDAIVVEAAHLWERPAAAMADVARPRPPDDAPQLGFREAVDAFKRELIQRAVRAEGGNWAGAARRLSVDRGNLQRTAHRLGLK